jgi:hypothetical protein
MARKPQTDLPDEMMPDWVQALNLPEVPPQKKGGIANPEHYRVRLARINLIAEASICRGGAIPFNAESMTKMIEREAEQAGLDPKNIADARSEGDKISDAVTRLLEDGDRDALFEELDEELDILEKQMAAVVERGENLIKDRAMMNIMEDNIHRGKLWLNRIRRVKRLREMTRHPIPKNQRNKDEVTQAAWSATHIIRYMLYVGRSSTIGMKTDTGRTTHIYQIGRHHIRFAVDTWEARNGVTYDLGKPIVGGRRANKGVILIAPPGHGKSEFASHYLALEIALRPRTQSLYIHAIVDKAQEQKAHVARLFSRDSAAGRKHLSIWPAELDKTDNNKTKMRVKLAERSKSPTVTATGIMSAQLGADTNIQILDDIVPQSDVDQPTERDRRFKLLSGTFGTRQRGTDTFRIVIGTFWHHDDALSRLWKTSDKSDLYLCSKQYTGGPNTSPPFFPLWPEVFPASELRRRFQEMNNNVSLWSANYMGNPISDESRLIKRLAYYDPESQDHQDFMASAIYHVSVDPTATNKESSDKAGIVYVAIGEVPIDVQTDKGIERGYVNRARVIDYKEVHNNQVELADTVARYALNRPVYQVHIETRSGFHATADLIASKWGIEAMRHDPGPKNKEQRLKQCAGVIDNSLAGLSALVEFPGVRLADGKVGPDDRHKEFYQQFLDFGYAPDDHCVDAVTQLVNHFLRSGDLVAGGAASVTIGKMMQSRNARMDAELGQYDNPVDSQTNESEDWRWFNERSIND